MTHLAIDSGRCIGCGSCASVCIRDNIVIEDHRAVECDSGTCFDCGHCMAVCTRNAITVDRYSDRSDEIVGYDPRSVPVSYDDLITHLERRRSVRWFTGEPVSRDKISKLIRAAELSPTAMNRQDVEFVVLSERFDEFMRLLGVILEPLSSEYPRIAQFGEYIRNGMVGRNPLTWDGRQLILAFSERQYDSFIAMSRMELAAPTIGLGGFYNMWIQKADVADHDRLMAFFGNIPSGKHLQAVFVIGHPRVSFRRTIPRDRARVSYQ